MKYLVSIIVISSLSGILNFAYVTPAMADSVQTSHSGSKSLSSGLSTAGAGVFEIVAGVLSVPVLIVDGLAADSAVSAKACDTCLNAFPIADEIITFESSQHDVD